MTDVESDKDLRNIFCRHRDNQSRILLDSLNSIPTCNGSHSVLTKAVRGKILWYRRLTFISVMIFAGLVLILVFAVIGMWFLRTCNRTSKFGGCSISFFSPFAECPVAF